MKPVVLISGAAGGIGSATAQAFARQGWLVVGVDRRPADVAGCHRFMRADLGEQEAAERVFAELGSRVGRLDALVNNAGVQHCRAIGDTTVEAWDEVMRSNVRSAFLAVRLARPLLAARGGSIVNVSSVHAVASTGQIAAYAASKGALLAMTRALAVELAPDTIRVNAVLPGAIDTPMLRSGLRRGHLGEGDDDALVRALGNRHPLARVGTPAEVAEAILFLCDATRSSFVTGQALVVDGGATARLSTE